MGGRLVVELAQQSPIKAAISYYGVNLENVLPALGQAAPALLHIAELDRWVQGEARETIELEVEKREGWESYVYAVVTMLLHVLKVCTSMPRRIV